jgi:hypothetical protein
LNNEDNFRLIRKTFGLFEFKTVSRIRGLNEEFIREFKEYLDWYGIAAYQDITSKFRKEFRKSIDFGEFRENI